jgi:hypothetical protein
MTKTTTEQSLADSILEQLRDCKLFAAEVSCDGLMKKGKYISFVGYFEDVFPLDLYTFGESLVDDSLYNDFLAYEQDCVREGIAIYARDCSVMGQSTKDSLTVTYYREPAIDGYMLVVADCTEWIEYALVKIGSGDNNPAVPLGCAVIPNM